MSRLFTLFFFTLALLSSQVVFGAPSCSHGMKHCVSKCKHRFGSSGFATGKNHTENHTSSSKCATTSTMPYSYPLSSPAGPTAKPSASPLSPSSTPTPPSSSSTTSSTPKSSPSTSVSPSDISAYLSAHNTVRAQHGASPLTWSEELSAKAQQWADGCVFKHSGGSLGPFGENLAAGTGDGFTIAAAVKAWTDEASAYDPNNPVASHFTQVVWKQTTQVGCAVQLCNGIFDPSFGLAHYYVCEYSPAGNVDGEFAQNVQV